MSATLTSVCARGLPLRDREDAHEPRRPRAGTRAAKGGHTGGQGRAPATHTAKRVWCETLASLTHAIRPASGGIGCGGSCCCCCCCCLLAAVTFSVALRARAAMHARFDVIVLARSHSMLRMTGARCARNNVLTQHVLAQRAAQRAACPRASDGGHVTLPTMKY